ncbi:hypothetical protein Fcan01_08726 [Folsomia candida]|uniref:Uncharacterized protein n=1 Tax=Folsomia candida TaxID=158441 RepID=A0A226EG33_FOLCA|nr:hypothetical protein Fcan01_08726 [Folsomia candida]
MQMLAYSTFILFIGITLRRECLQRHLSNSVIIVCTQLFSAARSLVDDLNKSIWEISLIYFTLTFPFLTVSAFEITNCIANGKCDWLKSNTIFLMLKLVVPLVASIGSEMTERLVGTPTRSDRRAYRAALISDFENAAKEPITLRCLGFFSIHYKWIVCVLAFVYGASCFLLELKLGLRKGAK